MIMSLLAFLTLSANVFLVLFFLLVILGKQKSNNWYSQLKNKLGPWAFHAGFIVTATATSGSLYFSEVLKYTPCLLCWYQRIFMYPQPILFLLAIIRKETVIKPYLLVLNIIGLTIASYHYFIQRFPTTAFTPCQIGGAVSCTKTYLLHFGYITIPFMAATAFLLNTVFITMVKEK